ncbi:MAG: NfeD family protein [Clostridia bacterium]
MFEIPMWIIWLIASGTFFIIEIFTVSFIMLWPGIAAAIVFGLSFFIDSVSIQIAVFSVISILLIIFTKPLTKKIFKSNNIPTNSQAIIGKSGNVLKEINNLKGVGQVKVLGEVWSATSNDDTIIEENANVEVVSIDGVKLKVKVKKGE